LENYKKPIVMDGAVRHPTVALPVLGLEGDDAQFLRKGDTEGKAPKLKPNAACHVDYLDMSDADDRAHYEAVLAATCKEVHGESVYEEHETHWTPDGKCHVLLTWREAWLDFQGWDEKPAKEVVNMDKLPAQPGPKGVEDVELPAADDPREA